jgi:hypothetical protein
VRLEISHVSMSEGTQQVPAPSLVVSSDRFGLFTVSATGLNFYEQRDVNVFGWQGMPPPESNQRLGFPPGTAQFGVLDFDYPENEPLDLRFGVARPRAGQESFANAQQVTDAIENRWVTARAAALRAIHSIIDSRSTVVHLLHTTPIAQAIPCELKCPDGRRKNGPDCLQCQTRFGPFLICCH